MKRVLIFTLLLCSVTLLRAQDYRKLKIGFHPGYIIPEKGDAGGTIALEPGFRITDRLAVNARFEVCAFNREVDTDASDLNVELGVGWIASYTANIQFYLLKGPVRPYLGFGLGYYVPGAVDVKASASLENGAKQEQEETIAPEAAFGFYPRVGVDIGHMNIVIDYNIVGDSEASFSRVKTENVDGSTTQSTVQQKTVFKNGYLALKLGFTIGGGKK